jgi:hypothetical protein
MLYKESAIAVMVAVMLGAASIFGGLSLIPALAAEPIASETVSQGSTESIIIDAIELTAEKSTSRADGTVTVKIVQGISTLRSGTLDTEFVKQNLVPVEVDVNNINVTGSFEILVEYQGSGSVTVSDIDVIEGTTAAGGPDDTNNEPDAPPQDNEPNESDEELENVVARETISPDDGSMIVDTVEFNAKKSTSRTDGALTIAIVQDDEILDSDDISTSVIKQAYNAHEVSFNDLEVTGDFEVVFMYHGSGSVGVNSINVPGGTVPADDPPADDPPADDPPAGTGSIEVYAHRIPSEFWAPNFTDAPARMWFSLHNSTGHVVFAGWFDETGAYNDDATQTKANINYLDASQTHYIYASGCDECHNDPHDVVFDHWEDGGGDNPRTLLTLSDQHAYYRYDPDP